MCRMKIGMLSILIGPFTENSLCNFEINMHVIQCDLRYIFGFLPPPISAIDLHDKVLSWREEKNPKFLQPGKYVLYKRCQTLRVKVGVAAEKCWGERGRLGY